MMLIRHRSPFKMDSPLASGLARIDDSKKAELRTITVTLLRVGYS